VTAHLAVADDGSTTWCPDSACTATTEHDATTGETVSAARMVARQAAARGVTMRQILTETLADHRAVRYA
jgi:hypothetical protein